MNTGILDNLEFPYPPVSIQRKYLLLRNKVIETQRKKTHLESMSNDSFHSLSKKAFAGEL